VCRERSTSKGLGLLPKNELLPGVYIASSLARAVNGLCHKCGTHDGNRPDCRTTRGCVGRV